MAAENVLPDSRLRSPKQGVWSAKHQRYMVQIYCANCGSKYGLVPEDMVNFAFALCSKCEATHGHPAHFYREPDAVFWDRVNEAMAEKQHANGGVALSVEQVALEIQNPTSTLAKLAKEWQDQLRKTIR